MASQNTILNDFKSAIISEMIAYEFYSKSSTTAKLISGMHAFQEMMWEEEKHVNMLKEKYMSLGGKEEIRYDPEEYGGLALPKLEVDAVVALDIAIKEEKASIKMYDEFLERNKGSDSAKTFEQILEDEKKHLGQWNSISKEISADEFTIDALKDEVYRFSKVDLETLKIALKAEKTAYGFYNNATRKIDTIEGTHAFQHMAWEEEKHVKILEDEYFRLVNKKPSIENLEQCSPSVDFERESDSLVALDLSIKEEKASLKRFLELEERCTNSKLREVIWGLIEDEWNHIKQWRSTQQSIKKNIIPQH